MDGGRCGGKCRELSVRGMGQAKTAGLSASLEMTECRLNGFGFVLHDRNHPRGTWARARTLQRTQAPTNPHTQAAPTRRKALSMRSGRMPETKIKRKGTEARRNPAPAT